jgi:multiple sugar transport system permease protein
VATGFAALLWGIPRLVETAKFYDYFINTIIVTVGTVVVSISIGCLAAYGLARYTGILGVIVLIAALGFRALPRMAFLLPFYWIGSALNLLDTRLLVILTMVAINQPFTIWMLRSFFMEIPSDLEEAAMIDGAGRFQAFLNVIIPIMWPGIISTALFSLLLAYNEFLLVRLLTQTNWTLPVAISRFTGGEDPRHLTLAAASAVSATIPIILVILFFQKNLVKGLAAGAVKG